MATTAAYPPHTEAPAFTRAQWKELERQAMIYKYMVASVPVPPQLLSSDFSAPTTPMGLGPLGYASIFNLKYGDNKDPEPGRCKRTDGKKWRCSRDVAPQQKYCERHMHRGRPRSRKPVEPQHQQQVSSSPKSNKKTRLVSAAPPPPGSPGLLGSTNELGNNSPSPLLLKTVSKVEEDVSLSLYTQHSQNRSLSLSLPPFPSLSLSLSLSLCVCVCVCVCVSVCFFREVFDDMYLFNEGRWSG
ncbi:hypothetical protein DCAR_0626048 [Daucus carota subsp. sativus]|uniref:Growth-regulating factor n=1 Tax=Daucus carota subsp. sativus TaxID=79200 RepID=A0AAF1B577_DAUCS|nr:hypothetical protein DCAR_0626048 [Daucus carota subsp. sativus]